MNVNENGSNNGNHQSKIEIDITGVCRKGHNRDAISCSAKADFVLGEHFCRFKSHLSVKPDAIITDMSGKLAVALELELTAKSERRYRDHILKYRLAKDFESVVYVTSSDAIRNKFKVF